MTHAIVKTRFTTVTNIFVYSAILIMSVTALGKLLSVMGSAEILDNSNPLFAPLTNRHVMFIACILELAVAYCAFNAKHLLPALLSIVWLSTILLIYRFALWRIDYQAPCDCLGAFTEALSISQSTANSAMQVILAYLLIGSYAFVIRYFVTCRKKVARQVGPSGDEGSKMTSCLLIGVITFSLLAPIASPTTYASTVTLIEGEVRVQNSPWNGGYVSPFTVYFDEKRKRYHLIIERPKEKLTRSELLYDGTNVYFVTHYKNIEKRAGKMQVADVSIDTTRVPPITAGSAAGPVWLGVCFPKLYEDYPEKLLPVYSTYYQNKAPAERLAIGKTGRGDLVELRFTNDSHVTAVCKLEYSDKREAVGVATVPDTFRITEYHDDEEGKIVSECRGVITNIAKSTVMETDFLPDVPVIGYSSFRDRRLVSEKVGDLAYTTNRVLSLAELRNTVSYAEARAKREYEEAVVKQRQIWAVAIGILLLCGGIAYWKLRVR